MNTLAPFSTRLEVMKKLVTDFHCGLTKNVLQWLQRAYTFCFLSQRGPRPDPFRHHRVDHHPDLHPVQRVPRARPHRPPRHVLRPLQVSAETQAANEEQLSKII